jgi:acyl-CoA thioester hydrolase
MTIEAHARYLRPAYFDDRLTIHTRCVDVRGARFRYEYVVERDGKTIADGWTGHACVDATTHRPTRVPDWLQEEIREAERASA